MKIKIAFYEDQQALDNLTATCMDIANDVLDAEGKLAILARQYQKAVLAEHDCTMGPEDGCNNPIHLNQPEYNKAEDEELPF